MTDRAVVAGDPVAVGARIEVEVGPVAHGGHCVARHEGQVVFVRHALPGERVRVEVTSTTTRYLRGDAVEILEAAPGRVTAPCPYAGPGGCGGCDWQHADLATQRELKAAVVAEQLQRLAGVTREVVVREVPGASDGLGWRTRERFSVDPDTRRLGLHRARSDSVVPLGACLLAHPGVTATGVLDREWSSARAVQVAASASTGDVAILVDGVATGRRRVRERAAGREWRVSADGFWQVHPGAADALTETVLALSGPREGEHVLDLYSGVGLYAGAIGEAVGAGGRVDAVEGSAAAVRDARRNLHDLPAVRLHEAEVGRWLARGGVRRCDLVVLDPPRSGAGPEVARRIASMGPRAVVYVACDPASLARDLATFDGLGLRLAELEVFDVFPMTHHVEAVALLERAGF